MSTTLSSLVVARTVAVADLKSVGLCCMSVWMWSLQLTRLVFAYLNLSLALAVIEGIGRPSIAGTRKRMYLRYSSVKTCLVAFRRIFFISCSVAPAGSFLM